jgi:hypothetical protein
VGKIPAVKKAILAALLKWLKLLISSYLILHTVVKIVVMILNILKLRTMKQTRI